MSLFDAPPSVPKPVEKKPCQYCGKLFKNPKRHELNCKDNPYVEKTVTLPPIAPSFSEDFWDAWNDLEPSIASVFRAKKWKSKYTSFKIVKRAIEGMKQ